MQVWPNPSDMAAYRISLLILICLCATVYGGVFNRLKDKISGRKSSNGEGVPPGAMAISEDVRQGQLSPIIILPGDGGSPIEALLDRPTSARSYCPKKTNGWDRVWADMDMVMPALVDCWVDNLKLVYNKTTRRTSNAPGVLTRVPGFGGTKSIEHLTARPLPSSKYMADLVTRLVANGYQRGVSIRGAPYDFRKAQNEQGEYFAALKGLVEDTYELNHKVPVTFIAHSLGCLYLLYFLNRQDQGWKDKYVSSMIGMGGPWGGSVKPLKVIASGDDLGISIVSSSRMREIIRTKPSITALFPSDKFWRRDEPLISTLDRIYTLDNLRNFFDDVNYHQGWDYYQDTKNLVYDLEPPRVMVYCLSGTGVPTPASYQYSNYGVPAGKPSIIFEDGDGTVNRRSLDACSMWATQQNQTVVEKKFDKIGHLRIVKDSRVHDYLLSIL